ncbi:hypothetical protein ACQP0C_31025 [Nocardia sp. CA-129566]|uniref:hypothetical protein n=1 Tax=Nocardia sp. CA-129566 TaxID=3239976 RepID=UPI003D95620C
MSTPERPSSEHVSRSAATHAYWTDAAIDQMSDREWIEKYPGVGIDAHLGSMPELERVTDLQWGIRRLILACVGFAAADDREIGFVTTQSLESGGRTGLRVVTAETMARRSLRISSSISVNPWVEVISLAAAGGTGALAAAVARGFRIIPAMIDLGCRISNLDLERRVQREEFRRQHDEQQILRAELRNRRAELDDEFLEMLLHNNLPAARRLIEALLEISPDAAGVATFPLTPDDIARMQRHALRATEHSGEIEGDRFGHA